MNFVVQRLIFPADQHLLPLYARVLPKKVFLDYSTVQRHSIVLEKGDRLHTNTYFNSFYEAYWRRHTNLGKLVLRVCVTGKGTLLLYRGNSLCGECELSRVDFDGQDQTIELEASAPPTEHHPLGVLFFDVVARSSGVTVHSAEWVAKDTSPKSVKLVAGYCTFNRETFVLNNIRTLMDQSDPMDCLCRIVVVDQGTRKVTSHPEYRNLSAQAIAKTLFVEQANLGGSGGFGRCMMEAMRMPGATHFLLLDDDAMLEPESIFRAAAFFALANSDVALGGPMLDLLQPLEMYTTGGFVVPKALGVEGLGRELTLQSPKTIYTLAEVQYSHFNGWWFFACPLSVAERLGLPMPFFIKCDDVEYCYRLMRQGVPILTLPGLGVWHLPFYVKGGGWDFYYSMRNMFVMLAIHFSPSDRAPAAVSTKKLVSIFLRLLLYRLLTMEYFMAWALCEGLADYLAGPTLLDDDPQKLHTKLRTIHRELSSELIPKTSSVCVLEKPIISPSVLRRRLALVGSLLRQLFRASPTKDTQPSLAVATSEGRWYPLRKMDVVAVDTPGNDTYVVLRRNRGRFVRLLSRGIWLAARLLLRQNSVAGKWRKEAKCFISQEFWRHYLGMTKVDASTSHDPFRPTDNHGNPTDRATASQKQECFDPAHPSIPAAASYHDKTLVVFLTMDRSGSSFITQAFQQLGMSLGPFELYGTHPHNKYGHFEARPIMRLQCEIQEQMFGFPYAMPPTRKILREFVAKEGMADWSKPIPQPWLDRGVSLLRELIASGLVSGFKEPHTAMLWPYWLQVFSQFPDLRIIPIFILRSPHAIAMSWHARELFFYRDSLDVTAVRLKRMNAIYNEWSGDRAIVRYDPAYMRDDLKEAVARCGLTWNEQILRKTYDAQCRHHPEVPIAHESQRHYDRLRRFRDPHDLTPDPEQLAKDAELRESLGHQKIDALRGDLAQRDKQIVDLQKAVANRNQEIANLSETARRLRSQLTRFEQHTVLRPILSMRRTLLEWRSRLFK